ncbi:BatD family protein [Abyssalbus ytuae]|uniref:BatD family protein n=1 Tax=Abyssalbus ytuae TaxID=2926907 RepID=A0A9E7A402_9FLAO|nr:BatD family protein [Abyssalbus ytuae]UOB19476.1 BatD family protein [Abyssalbus ytuae]
MNMVKNYIIVILVLVANFSFAQDDNAVNFEAKVSKETLGLNERLRIDFSMNKDGDNFTPPGFEGFRVLMGPNQSISNSWINGKRTFSKTYSYILSPTARGKFTIKQATVEIDGDIYKTLPINIEVTAAVDKPNEEKTADDIADDNLHLVAEVSNQNPYLNQAVSIIYKLYVSPNISVSDFKPLDNPKYNDFWSQDIEVKRWKVENGTYNGKPYRYVILKKVVVYPQKTGKLSIEPLSLDVTVDVPTNRRDIFGGRLYTQTHKTVSAGSRAINVKALPEKGKPADFTGAVGQFDFNVITSKTDLKASESLTVKVNVDGKGNLNLFELPSLSLPSSLEVYEPEFDKKVSTSISGMQGTVSNSYTVVPQYKGKYPIPSVSFSYFDPVQRKYKTISSQEILINVFEGPVNSGESTSSSPVATNYKQPVMATGNQFQFIKLNANLKPVKEKIFFKSTLFYSLLFGPLLLIPLFIIVGKKKKAIQSDVEGNRIRKANKLAKKYLSEAKRAIGKKEAFYEAMERALHNYLKAKLKIETSDLSKDKISELLTSRNVNDETVNNFISLLNSCELARYTPTTEVTIQQDYEKAANVISQIDKQIKI